MHPKCWMRQKHSKRDESAERNYEVFLKYQNEHDSSWPVLIRDISEAQANDIKLYERYAFG